MIITINNDLSGTIEYNNNNNKQFDHTDLVDFGILSIGENYIDCDNVVFFAVEYYNGVKSLIMMI